MNEKLITARRLKVEASRHFSKGSNVLAIAKLIQAFDTLLEYVIENERSSDTR